MLTNIRVVTDENALDQSRLRRC